MPLTRCGAAAMARSTASRNTGGPNAVGTVFRFDPVTGDLRTLHAFTDGNDGGRPFGGLVEVGAQLYGVTSSGGPALALKTAKRDDLPHRSVHRRVHCAARVQLPRRDTGLVPVGTAGPGAGRHAVWDDALRRLRGGRDHLPAEPRHRRVHHRPRDDQSGRHRSGGTAAARQRRRLLWIGVRRRQQHRGRHDLPLRSRDEPTAAAVLAHVSLPTGHYPDRWRRLPTAICMAPPTTARCRRAVRARRRSSACAARPRSASRRSAPSIRRPLGAGSRCDWCSGPMPGSTATPRPTDRPVPGRSIASIRWPADHRPTRCPLRCFSRSARSLVANAPRLVRGRLPVRYHAVRRRERARTRLSPEPGDRRRHAARHAAGRTGADVIVELCAGRGAGRAARWHVPFGDRPRQREPHRPRRSGDRCGVGGNERTNPKFPSVQYPAGPLARLSGALYGLRHDGAGRQVFRFDPQTSAVADVASTPPGVSWSPTSLLAATDGQLYLTSVVPVPLLLGRLSFRYDGQLWRVNTRRWHCGRGGGPGSVVHRQFSGPGAGRHDLHRSQQRLDPTVLLVDLQTNQVRPVCTIASEGYVGALSVASDGTLFGTLSLSRQERFHCNPATGATSVEFLSPEIGRVAEPFTTVTLGGLSYGAAWAGGPAGGTLFRLAPTARCRRWTRTPTGCPTCGKRPTARSVRPPATRRRRRSRRRRPHQRAGVADGTHPRGRSRATSPKGRPARSSARGSISATAAGAPAIVLLRFLTDAGVTCRTWSCRPPSSHASLDPATLPVAASFSTVVESDAAIVVDRTMSWARPATASTPRPRARAVDDLVSRGRLDLWRLLRCSTCCRTRADAGDRDGALSAAVGCAPIERLYTLPPRSRTTISGGRRRPELATTDVSAVIPATVPIIAERAMYLDPARASFARWARERGRHRAGHEWFLAEGATGPVLRPVRAAGQPESAAGEVAVDYLLVGGGTLTKTYTVPANAASRSGWTTSSSRRARATAARQRRGVDARPLDQRRADRRRAHDVVAGAGADAELLVRGAQLAGRDDDGDAWGSADGEMGGRGRRRDLHPDRQSVDNAGRARVT